MCIYLIEKEGLHYDSADHIIPAGLGGIKKLPSDYVSREFNGLSSKLEQALMRDSIISLPRQIMGPGKRGSLEENKATKSKINVFKQQGENGSFSLGYIQKGKPYEIPHITIDIKTGAYGVGMNAASTNKDLELFKNKLLNFAKLRIKMIEHAELEDTYILGVTLDKDDQSCYIASKDGKTHPLNGNLLKEIEKVLTDRSIFASKSDIHVKTHQSATMGEEVDRCFAKIAFNCLAHLKGKEFVLRECFDPIRDWVVKGGENKFVSLIGQNETLKNLFPQDSHHVIITKADNTLIAEVCLYNHFRHLIRLSDLFEDRFELDGFICDWNSKKEYTYYEYFSKQNNHVGDL